MPYIAGVIHGDFNEQNILVKPTENDKALEGEYDIAGLIDFGDMHIGCYIYEVGIAIMYMMLDSQEVPLLDTGGYFLSGYLSKASLTQDEFGVLKYCVAARYAQSIVMGYYTYAQDKDNDYVKPKENAWVQLKALWETPTKTLHDRWKDIINTYRPLHFEEINNN